VKKACRILPVALVALGILVPTTASHADEDQFGECPDGYHPTVFPLPQDDRNENGVVCVKFVNSHANVKDDPSGTRYRCNGFPTPPPECSGDPEGSIYVVDDSAE
jgi:hypothetical protein